MSIFTNLSGQEIEAAFAKVGTPFGKLLHLATIGDMSHPLKVEIGKVLQEHKTLSTLFDSTNKEIGILRRQNGSLGDLVHEYRAALQDKENELMELRREVERLSGQELPA